MTILYFGIYNPGESRNKIYMDGLKENGVQIIECRDQSWGPLKFIKLFFKHWRIRNDYDYLMVGYPGHIVVPFAKLISQKPVILDALCSLYEGVIVSRGQSGLFLVKEKYTHLIDKLAIKYADIILLETNSQKKLFEEKLHAPLGKCFRVFTGASDRHFYPDKTIAKNENFTVVFRGKFLPEAGVCHVIETAKILESQGVDFVIIGNGFLENEIMAQINKYKLKNLKLIYENLSYDDLRKNMLACHVSLGQLEDHKRLLHTIPHKCFETLAMGLPYVTAKAPAISEILTDGENCLFVNPADPQDLAQKILMLKNDHDLLKKIGDNGYKLYQQKFTPKILAKDILNIIS